MARKRAHRRAVLPMAVDIFAVGETVCSCTCSGGTATTFEGCNGFILANYQIDIYDHSGGTLLQSVTTDSSGVATVTPTGSVWIQSHDGRFSGQTITLSATVSLSVLGTGFLCLTKCSVPTTTVLHGTFSVLGSATLTWNSGANLWLFQSAGFPSTGAAIYLAKNLIITFYCPPSGVQCGGASLINTYTCPPSLSLTVTTTFQCSTQVGNGTITE